MNSYLRCAHFTWIFNDCSQYAYQPPTQRAADRQSENGREQANAVGRSILVIVWHLLSDPEAHYRDLGPDFYDNRINSDRKKCIHIRQLKALCYTVTLQPAA
jgi:hypothetical protein